MVDHSVGLGDIVGSKYRVERVLGAGGMGMVLAARHLVLGHLVAVKVMRPQTLRRERATDRFLREAQAAARLTSQHVARVLDVGQLDSGAPYMVMEHLRGSDLAAILVRRGPLPIEEAVEYVLQACEAIAEAHAVRIAHRDIKPANLFLTENPDGSPCVKVLDFGIAKMTGPSQPSTSSRIVSIGYAAPEQILPEQHADHRADIWALGVTLYELIAGQKPFKRDSFDLFVRSIMRQQPSPLRKLRTDVPDGLEAAILKCLQKQPDERFQSVADLARALVTFAPVRAAAYAGRVAALLDSQTAPAPSSGDCSSTDRASVGAQSLEENPARDASAMAGTTERAPLAVATAPLPTARIEVKPKGSVRPAQSSHTRRIPVALVLLVVLVAVGTPAGILLAARVPRSISAPARAQSPAISVEPQTPARPTPMPLAPVSASTEISVAPAGSASATPHASLGPGSIRPSKPPERGPTKFLPTGTAQPSASQLPVFYGNRQ
jgi:eukaryotic-like serine/threonine-protein kinase